MWPFSKKIEQKAMPKPPGMRSYFMPMSGCTQFSRNKKAFIQEGYIENVVAYRCINSIANMVASIPLEMFEKTDDEYVQIHDSPILSLLENPSRLMDYHDFTEAMIAYYYITGNSYAALVKSGGEYNKQSGTPLSIYAIPSQFMNPIGGNYIGYINSYQYKSDDGVIENYKVDPVTGESDIFHMMNFNPGNTVEGLSILEPAAFSIDVYNEMSKHNKSLLQNGATPSGALVVKTVSGETAALDDDQYSRLKAELEEQYSGTVNTGRPMLLEGGLEWQSMSYSPEELMMLDNKQETARDIARAFNFPPMLLGIPGDNTYSNLQEARLALYDEVVIPLAKKYARKMGQWLISKYTDDKNLILQPDLSSITALQDRRLNIMEKLDEISFLSINEKRHECDYEDADSGDEILIDANKIPLSLAGSEISEEDTKALAKSIFEIKSDAEK